MGRPRRMYALDDYHYHLPEDLIAQTPSPHREGARLLHLDRRNGRCTHRQFSDIVALLRPSDVLVVNDTRVVPSRLFGRKQSGGRVELLLLDYGHPREAVPPAGPWIHRCLIRASKAPGPGTRILFDEALVAEVIEGAEGTYTVAFSAPRPLDEVLQRIGRIPLPPYIKRDGAQLDETDRHRYQTVYARHQGAVAAPTAGLHFTEEILSRLAEKGVTRVAITLHVGYGTFMPVRVTDIRSHRMHDEWFSISPAAARSINQAKAQGRRVVAVGTTSVRTLEYAARPDATLHPGTGRCDLFIYPGHPFRMVDAMITNFHLPRSTLLMLVSAFADRETVLRTYAAAVAERYRFFSYGDAMLIE